MMKKYYTEKAYMLKEFLNGNLKTEELSDKDKSILVELLHARTQQINNKIEEDKEKINQLKEIEDIINKIKFATGTGDF